MSAIQIDKLRLASRIVPSFGETMALGTIGAVSAALVALFLVREQGVVGALGMPLDDAWIHFNIARNLATGQGFSYNPGEPTSASTSPLWTALLALFYLATGQFVVPAVVLGVFFYLACNVAVYYVTLSMKSDRKLALVAAVFVAVTGRWVWASFSGMETTLFTALTMWGLLLFTRPGLRRTPTLALGSILLALAALARPGGFVLLGMVIGWSVLSLLVQPGFFSHRPVLLHLCKPKTILPIMALIGALVVRLAYTVSTGGGVFGNTFMAQSLPQGAGPYTGPRLFPDLWYLRNAVQSLRTDDFLLGLLIPVGVVLWIRLARHNRSVRSLAALSLLWFVALPLFNSMVAPNLRHHERYLMPLIPWAILFGTFGISALVELTVGGWWRRRIPWVRFQVSAGILFALVTAVTLGDALLDATRWASQYAGDVRSIQRVQVEMGRWIRDNTPPSAYIALNDIGAITFISNRRVLDTVGIAEAGILPYLAEDGRQGVFEYLRQKRPDYLVVWPEWYPEMAAMADIFTPIHSIEVGDWPGATRQPMQGGDVMVVYKARWPER
ncbi:MAG: hypothetical protein EPO21_10845 [Chloroflexota bacterium]|nr:MAG: hypothetical protein EPO21_10845 [Chloroflexota bacterium]